MPLAIGSLLHDRYRILSILGQGGMGAVYCALDEHLGISVAVKENLFLSEEFSRQFKKEASILATLRHINLPHVSDYFICPGQGQYLVMDFIEGEDLRQRLQRQGVISEKEAILIGINICDALSHLHSHNPAIIHRDIKPGNIKITPEGQVVLVDFGLAKVMSDNQATSTGARATTPGYSPPEQYGSARTDPRSDIYSLGATLYAALTGVIPEDALIRLSGKTELTPIRNLRANLNPTLAQTIEKALSLSPEDRFQSAQDFRAVLIQAGKLNRLIHAQPTVTPPPPSQIPENSIPASFPINSVQPPVPVPEAELPVSKPIASRPRQKRLGYFLIPLFIPILVISYWFFVYQWDATPWFAFWSGSVLNGLPFSQFNSATPILTITSTPTIDSIPQPSTPTITPSPAVVVSSPTLTATSTPRPTPSPTISETPLPSVTPIGGGFSQIAFSSNRTGIMQIWLMNTEGRLIRQITNQPDGACQPAWSPDGNRLAFTSPCPGKNDTYPGSSIFIINVDGSGLIRLPSTPDGDFDPAWSPDGKKIAFTSLRGGKPSIYVYTFGSDTVQDISQQSRYPDRHPAWNPIGQQLAFIRTIVNGQVWLMTDNGQTQSQFSVSGNVDNLYPAWSPNGEILFYSQVRSPQGIPLLMGMRYEDRKTAREFRIPTNPQVDPGPIAEISVSPDGFWIVYESWPDGNNHDIYLATINGTNPRRLTSDPAFDFSPAWRPIQLQP